MARFLYNGTQELIFTSLTLEDGSTLHAIPGGVYDIAGDVADSRFVPAGEQPAPVVDPLSGETIQHEPAPVVLPVESPADAVEAPVQVVEVPTEPEATEPPASA